MQLVPMAVEARVAGETQRVAIGGDGEASLGPLSVEVRFDHHARHLTWSVANRDDRPVPVRSVAIVLAVLDVRPPLRLFRHGYQSWSPTGVATFGLDRDPSTVPGAIEFLQAGHHADQHDAADGELRSEWVTVLADAGGGEPTLVGFDGGHDHDGTLRLRQGTDGDGIELAAEAFLGDLVLTPGEQRRLHDVRIESGDDPSALLASWARGIGTRGGARVAAPYQVGWCSWYHYFHDVTEDALRANLARADADAWPFDVFQLDDGYQAGIGDWLETNERFPASLEQLSATIAGAGFRPGLWLAPFLVAPDSQVFADHPDWIARRPNGDPLFAWWNPPWGGGADGFMYGLDATQPAVLEHLCSLAASLVDAGFTYLKLDFTFAPSVDGVWSDASRTPAQRVRAGYQAIRDGAGEDTFLLGCGVPLAHVVGLVDANRIGQDVAPEWALDPAVEVIPGYLEVQPSTQLAYVNTLNRSFLHRNLWLNDPDCLMLRTEQTSMSPEAIRTWARTVGVSGGMALVSDDLSLLDANARALLDETIALGRASDADAIDGRPAVAVDLLDAKQPTTFTGGGHTLVTDPLDGTSSL